LPLGQAVIVRQLDFGFKPEFGFAICALHMDMHSRLLAREEVEAKAILAEDGGAH